MAEEIKKDQGVTQQTAPAEVFECDTWLYSKKFPSGKLFLTGEEKPAAQMGFVESPADI